MKKKQLLVLNLYSVLPYNVTLAEVQGLLMRRTGSTKVQVNSEKLAKSKKGKSPQRPSNLFRVG